MKTSCFAVVFRVLCILVIMSAVLPITASSHCDSMNGPVVSAAKLALGTGNVNLVLIWVQKKDEPAIRDAFAKTLSVRRLDPEAQKLADMYFFETLVRIHRAGEGESYTGLKPADAEVDPGIEAADAALATASVDELVEHLNHALRDNLVSRFKRATALQKFDPSSVEAGREYVKAYVEFIHYVESVHAALAASHQNHGEGSREQSHHPE